MIQAKENFLKHAYIPLLKKLQPGQVAKWGKMDSQQMVEHMRDACKLANGKLVFPLLNSDPEKLSKARAFMMSEELFKENTKVAIMPDEPRPHKFDSLSEAIHQLEPELNLLFVVFAADPLKTLVNPVFGELNYEEQICLLYKHAKHHLRQFGLVE